MKRSNTQFAVALAGVFFLGAATLLVLIGDVFFDKPSELTFALVTALTGVTSGAAAYLFRLNGQSGD